MSVELTSGELDLVQRAAVRAAALYRGYTTAEDIKQELIAWMLHPDREEKVREWREGEGWRALNKSLFRQARKVCRREKALAAGYKPEDEAFYSWGMVRELLPSALSADAEWAFDDAVNGRPDSNTANMVIDVRRGLKLISKADAKFLTECVDAEWDYEYLAHKLGSNYNQVQKRCVRTLRKLASAINGDDREPESEEALRAWQNEAYATVPRYSSAAIINLQRNMEWKQ